MNTKAIGRPKGKHSGRQHGTRSMYQGGCRCPECTRACRAYQREWYRTWKLTPVGKRALERARLRDAARKLRQRGAGDLEPESPLPTPLEGHRGSASVQRPEDSPGSCEGGLPCR